MSLIKLLDCKRLGPGGAQVGDVLIHLRARVCATRHEVGIYPPSCGRITGRGDVEHGSGCCMRMLGVCLRGHANLLHCGACLRRSVHV